MSLEAIAAVERAEADAQRIKAEAVAEAKRVLAGAEAAGCEAVEAARRKAGEELKEMSVRAEEKAADEVAVLRQETEARKGALRAGAESRMNNAAGKIVERIVNG